jgi:hypothetical protein
MYANQATGPVPLSGELNQLDQQTIGIMQKCALRLTPRTIHQ